MLPRSSTPRSCLLEVRAGGSFGVVSRFWQVLQSSKFVPSDDAFDVQQGGEFPLSPPVSTVVHIELPDGASQGGGLVAAHHIPSDHRDTPGCAKAPGNISLSETPPPLCTPSCDKNDG